MKLLLNILYFSTIITLMPIKQSLKANEMEKYLDKYAKYVVYVYGRRKNFYHYWIGVIVQDDIVLTAYIAGGKFKKNKNHLDTESENTTLIKMDSFIDYARVIAGTRRFVIVHDTPKLRGAINISPSIRQLPQLSVVKLEEKLTLNKKASIVSLPSHRYSEKGECISLCWGDKSPDYALIAYKVRLEGYCGHGIMCFKHYVRNEVANHCGIYAGGEPIFCSGTLVAIVSFLVNCNNTQPAMATSVYDNLKWIKAAIKDLSKYDGKSGCNVIAHINLYIFFIIYLFIKTIYNNIIVQ